MSPFLAGLIGAVVGYALKYVGDLLTEKRRNQREDVLWKRARYVEAAAQLVTASGSAQAGHAAVSLAVFSLHNAEGGRDPEIIQHCRAQLKDAYGRLPEPTLAVNQAVGLIRLYGPEEVVSCATRLREAANVTPEPGQIGAQSDAVELANAELVEAVRSSLR